MSDLYFDPVLNMPRRYSPPWRNPAVELWLDQEPDVIETMDGIRYTQQVLASIANSQYHTSPHISELDGATAVTFEFWKADYEYNAANKPTDEAGYFGQGGAANGSYNAGSGFRFASYATAGSGCHLLTNVSNSTYKRAGVAINPATSRSSTSHLFVYDGSNTPRVWIDGEEKVLAINDPLPSALPSGSAVFQIGSGYRMGGYTWFLARIWLRALSTDEANAVVQNRKAPVRYADLESTRSGLSTGVLRNWENTNLTCPASGAVLTAVNTPTTETFAWRQRCRATGQYFSNMIGLGNKLDTTGVFKAGRNCFENSVVIPSAGATYSGAHLLGESAPNPWPAVGGILDQTRLKTIPAAEAFGYAIYGAGANLAYTMPGIANPSAKPTLRGNNTGFSPAYNGSVQVNETAVIDTNYTTRWIWDGTGIPSCNINGVDKETAFNMSSGSSFYPNQQGDQSGHGTVFRTGNICRGYKGTTIRFRRQPSARLLAEIDAMIND